MYQIIMKPTAIEMARDAYEWYNEQQSGLGDEFFEELKSCRENSNHGLKLMQKSKSIIGNL